MTERMLEIVLEHAARAGAARVTDVHLVIGELSGFADECVAFHWEILSRGTAAQGAALHFRKMPFMLRCSDCGEEFAPAGAGFACASCGGGRVRVAGGEEMRVEAIDVDGVAGGEGAGVESGIGSGVGSGAEPGFASGANSGSGRS